MERSGGRAAFFVELEEAFQELEDFRIEQQEKRELVASAREDYVAPDEAPQPPIPAQWLYLKFLEYRGWTERTIARMSIQEAWTAWLIFSLEYRYGQLQKRSGGF